MDTNFVIKRKKSKKRSTTNHSTSQVTASEKEKASIDTKTNDNDKTCRANSKLMKFLGKMKVRYLEDCSDESLYETLYEDGAIAEYLCAAIEDASNVEEYVELVSSFMPQFGEVDDFGDAKIYFDELRTDDGENQEQKQVCVDASSSKETTIEVEETTNLRENKKGSESEESANQGQSGSLAQLLSLLPASAKESIETFKVVLEDICNDDVYAALEYISVHGIETIVSTRYAANATSKDVTKRHGSEEIEEIQGEEEEDHVGAVADSTNLEQLLGFLPEGANPEAMKYVLENECRNNINAALDYIFENGVESIEAKYKADQQLAKELAERKEIQEREEQERVKRGLLQKFDEFAVGRKSDVSQTAKAKQLRKMERKLKKQREKEKQAGKVRFFEGKVVSRNGERYT